MRQILTLTPGGLLGIFNPARSLLTKGDKEMTDAEVEARAFNDISTKFDPPHSDIKFASVNTTLNETDREFRNGIRENTGVCFHNMVECKELAHAIRREKRDKEMKPYDDIIAKQIPGQDAAQAEVERQKIRAADAVKQGNIDIATTIVQLKAEIR